MLTFLGSAGDPVYQADNAVQTESDIISKSLPRTRGLSRFKRPPSYVRTCIWRKSYQLHAMGWQHCPYMCSVYMKEYLMLKQSYFHKTESNPIASKLYYNLINPYNINYSYISYYIIFKFPTLLVLLITRPLLSICPGFCTVEPLPPKFRPPGNFLPNLGEERGLIPPPFPKILN